MRPRRCTAVLALACGLLAAVVAGAAEPVDTGALRRELAVAKRLLERARSDAELNRAGDLAAGLKVRASACVADAEKGQREIEQALQTLGEVAPGAPADVRRKRQELERRLAAVTARAAECRAVLVEADELASEVAARRRAALADRLARAGPHLGAVAVDAVREWRAVWTGTRQTLRGLTTGVLSAGHWAALLTLSALAAALGAWLRRRRVRHRLSLPGTRAGRLGAALLWAWVHYLPALAASAAAASYMWAATRGVERAAVSRAILLALPAYLAVRALVRALVSPKPPLPSPLGLDRPLARRLARRLEVLLTLVFLAYLLEVVVRPSAVPDSIYLLSRAVLALLLAANLSLVLRIAWRRSRTPLARLVVAAGVLGTWAAVAAEWAGYRPLAEFLLRGVAGTLLAVGAARLAATLMAEACAELERPTHPWSQRLRGWLALSEGERFPGIAWLRAGLSLIAWLAAAWGVVVAWQVADAVAPVLREFMLVGFSVGTVHIVPVRLIGAVVVTAATLAVVRALKGRMEREWLAGLPIERGARESMAALAGYVGGAIAVLLGLGMAGVEFRNLALIAGALSVGIGFGLQNVVNNFVSGLILLFERPIKTGDWVVVGNTEGYVRRIRIRSTVIQTFDRADVIVPNSELISTQVTNWMLRDPRGRVRVPVGVAYGSDTARVREILLAVAAEHPRVVTDGSAPEPYVLFLGFGDSSLNFELRCFIFNIDERLRVLSDLNFAIDRAFRDAGIEIPFPQRDLHLRSGTLRIARAPHEEGEA